MRMWVILNQFEILVFKVEDALHLRIDLHLRELTWLTGELKFHLLEVVCIYMSVSCCVNKLTRLKAADLSDHHGQKSIGSDIERNSEENIGTTLIKLARELAVSNIELE